MPRPIQFLVEALFPAFEQPSSHCVVVFWVLTCLSSVRTFSRGEGRENSLLFFPFLFGHTAWEILVP